MGMNEKMIFYVGGYAEPGQNGLLKCAYDGEGIDVIDANDELRNPSWITAHPSKGLIYAVEELSPEGAVAVLAEERGHMRVLAKVPSKGADPCHIAITPDGRHLLVSNYTGGSLSVYAMDEDGLPTRMTDHIQHRMDDARRGIGNPLRQDGPHIHFSYCDGKRVYINDLGLNRVFVYGWDGEAGRLIDRGQSIDFPEGSGPRHLAFNESGDRMYVLCELSATIHVFRREPERGWRRAQVVRTVPEDFMDFEKYAWSCGAAIHFAGSQTLCASTRGHDSLAVFAVGEDGLLGERRLIPSGGRTPRDFMPIPGGFLVANQGSDAVCALRREDDPVKTRIPALAPTCICARPGNVG